MEQIDSIKNSGEEHDLFLFDNLIHHLVTIRLKQHNPEPSEELEKAHDYAFIVSLLLKYIKINSGAPFVRLSLARILGLLFYNRDPECDNEDETTIKYQSCCKSCKIKGLKAALKLLDSGIKHGVLEHADLPAMLLDLRTQIVLSDSSNLQNLTRNIKQYLETESEDDTIVEMYSYRRRIMRHESARFQSKLQYLKEMFPLEDFEKNMKALLRDLYSVAPQPVDYMRAERMEVEKRDERTKEERVERTKVERTKDKRVERTKEERTKVERVERSKERFPERTKDKERIPERSPEKEKESRTERGRDETRRTQGTHENEKGTRIDRTSSQIEPSSSNKRNVLGELNARENSESKRIRLESKERLSEQSTNTNNAPSLSDLDVPSNPTNFSSGFKILHRKKTADPSLKDALRKLKEIPKAESPIPSSLKNKIFPAKLLAQFGQFDESEMETLKQRLNDLENTNEDFKRLVRDPLPEIEQELGVQSILLDKPEVFERSDSATQLRWDESRFPESQGLSESQRRRKPYSNEEVSRIIEGYKKYGNQWALIRDRYQIQRTNVDIKDKVRNLKSKGLIND